MRHVANGLLQSTEHLSFPELSQQRDEKSLDEIFNRVEKEEKKKAKLDHNLNNKLAHLKATQFMQELNTIQIEARRKDFSRNKVSNSIVGSSSYKGREKTQAEKEAEIEFKVKKVLQEQTNLALFKRFRGGVENRRVSKFWGQFERKKGKFKI